MIISLRSKYTESDRIMLAEQLIMASHVLNVPRRNLWEYPRSPCSHLLPLEASLSLFARNTLKNSQRHFYRPANTRTKHHMTVVWVYDSPACPRGRWDRVDPERTENRRQTFLLRNKHKNITIILPWHLMRRYHAQGLVKDPVLLNSSCTHRWSFRTCKSRQSRVSCLALPSRRTLIDTDTEVLHFHPACD